VENERRATKVVDAESGNGDVPVAVPPESEAEEGIVDVAVAAVRAPR